MEKIEISTAKTDLTEIARYVSKNRVTIELVDGEVALARIVPLEQKHSMAELDRAMRDAQRLGEDAHSFATDVLSARPSIGELVDPWES
jgi:hypothetical protein